MADDKITPVSAQAGVKVERPESLTATPSTGLHDAVSNANKAAGLTQAPAEATPATVPAPVATTPAPVAKATTAAKAPAAPAPVAPSASGKTDFTIVANAVHGDTVGGKFHITGSGFGAGGTVLVNGESATIEAWGGENIYGRLPVGARSGEVIVVIDDKTRQVGRLQV